MDTKILRHKILDLAIHGRLVPQDPSDEPASALLARIRAEKEQLVADGKLKKKDLASTPVSDEDKPFDVPEGWEWCRLGEICKIQSSKRIHKHDYVPSGVPFYRTTEIKELSEGNPISNCLYIKEEQYNIIKDSFGVPQKGDTLISAVGTIGITYTIQDNNPFYFKDGNLIWISQSSAIDSIFLSEILGYLVRDKGTISTSGSAYNALTIEKLNSYPIPLPPLAEQHRIVAAVEQWMSLVDIIESGQENLHQSIALAKNKILDLAIKGKLVEKEGEWEEKTLGEVCMNTNGLWKGKKEPFVNVGVIRNANFTKDFKLDYSKIEYIDVEAKSFEKRSLKNGDLIVEKSGGSDKNPVGRAILYEGDDDKYSFSNFTMAIRIKDKSIVSSKYLYYCLLNTYKSGIMASMQTQTTGLHNLILDKYLSIPIPLPPLSEQHRIVAKIEELFTQLDNIAEALK